MTQEMPHLKIADSASIEDEKIPQVLRIVPSSGWFDLPFKDIWAYRELLYFLVWKEIKVRYKQTAIGAAWALIQPLMTMFVFTIFFGRLAKMPSEGLPHPVFYLCTLIPWTYFATAFQNSTNSIVENQRMITKVYFSRVLLPLSAVLSGLLDFGISLSMLIVLMAFYGIAPTPMIIFLPLFLILMILTALALGLWLTALNALYRDVRYVVPFLTQLMMFASPVVYPSSLISPKWRVLYGLNPLAGAIEGFRWAITGHGEPPTLLLIPSVCAVIILLFGGLVFFHRIEGTIADSV